jgi:acyl-CoA thioester hydrolase
MLAEAGIFNVVNRNSTLWRRMSMEGKSERALSSHYPVVIEVPVAWGDMDAQAHVNNTVYFRYFESARIAYFDRIGFRGGPGRAQIGPILGSTHCRFRRPLTYPDTVYVGVRVAEIGTDRLTLEQRIVSRRLGEVAAEGGAVIVCYDYAAGRKALLPDSVRERIVELESSVSAATEPRTG